ncbi:hypothetical protein B0J14DRAFT_19743 [Halenospora varia]|nr:hypothetical protein B0J14DRAFT_19743 [Halenospora varia]
MVFIFDALAIALALFVSFANGFLPGPLPFGLGWIAGATNHHASQTEWAIKQFLERHFILDFGPENDLMPPKVKQARKTIVDANMAVDSPDEKNYKEKNYGPAHFDDELFQEGQDRLMKLRSEMITFLRAGDVELARIFLGRQLHGLQDFYAHSNWVEQNLDRTDLSPFIGTPGAKAYSPAKGPTCTEFCLETSVMTAAQLAKYNTHNQCLRSSFVGDQENKQLVRGFRSAQKCGDDNDNFCTAPGPCSPNQKFACEFNMIDYSEVTTGYYFVPGVERTVKPEGKCSHGGLNDAASLGIHGIEGINKDSLIQTYSPHWFYHLRAASLAQRASLKYIQDLTVDWGYVNAFGTSYPQPALTDRELKILFGLGSGTLAFVIDTTGSMGSVISSVRSTVADIVKSVKSTDQEPTGYVLMGYNDPVGSNLLSTQNADTFIAQLNTLFAFGGDDCPEPAIAAVSIVLDKVDSYSTVFLFTDAGAKDPENLDATIQKARTKKSKVTIFEFVTCTTPLIYKSLSGSTGGSYFSLSDRTATASLTQFALRSIQSDEVLLYSDSPTSIKPLRRRAESSIQINVDSAMKSIFFSASGPASLTITRPDGTIINADDAEMSTYLVGLGYTFVSIDNPQSGTWAASRSDTSSTGLSVTASSFLTFNSFDFVELKGTHPGWFPIVDDVVPGTTYNVSADIEGQISTASFQFRDTSSGELLTSFDLTKYVPEGNITEHVWHGEVMVPCGAFSAYVIGKDTKGAPFQRMYPVVFGDASSNCTLPVTNTSTAASSSFTSTTKSSSLASTARSSSISKLSGNWTMTSATPSSTSCIACQQGQGVSMTERVIVLSTVSVCPYTTTISPCPTDSGKASCVISTSSVTLTPFGTTTVMVPVPSCTEARPGSTQSIGAGSASGSARASTSANGASNAAPSSGSMRSGSSQVMGAGSTPGTTRASPTRAAVPIVSTTSEGRSGNLSVNTSSGNATASASAKPSEVVTAGGVLKTATATTGKAFYVYTMCVLALSMWLL